MTPPVQQPSTSIDYQVRLQTLQDQMNRFEPEKAAKWFDDVKAAHEYAGIKEETALRNILPKVNDNLPPKKKIAIDAQDTYVSFKKKLEKAFEPDMKQMLFTLMTNSTLGDRTFLEYYRTVKSIIGDTDDQARSLILNLMNQVLPNKSLKMEATKLFYTQNKTLEEVATEMDKILENYSEVESTKSTRMPTETISQALLNRLEVPKEEVQRKQGIEITVDLTKRLAKLEQQMDEEKMKRDLDKREIISTIQSAQHRSRSRERYHENYHGGEYSRRRPSPKGPYRAIANGEDYYEPYQRRYGGEESYKRNTGYGDRNYRYGSNGQEFGGYRNRGQSSYQDRRYRSRSVSRGPHYANYKDNSPDLCWKHRKFGDDCYPELCKVGCSRHPSGMCYYHYRFKENAYPEKCPQWCKHNPNKTEKTDPKNL